MNIIKEFETIDLIVHSSCETRGVDAFSLAIIKAERQLRKLFTHLIFQFSCFKSPDIDALRSALASNRNIYFGDIENFINMLFSHSVEEMVGLNYRHLRQRINEASQVRNKIFHGQLTKQQLSREDLLDFVRDIHDWCAALSTGAENKIGYNGFARNSFQKSTNFDLAANFKVNLNSVDDYSHFLEQNTLPKRYQPAF